MNSRKIRNKEKDTQEKEFLIRNKKYGVKELNMNMHNKKDLIDKLKRILSKKYQLEDKDYIIIIDKFKLDDKNITKETIEELISYLNMELRYNTEESLEKIMETELISEQTLEKKTDEIRTDIVPIEPPLVRVHPKVYKTTPTINNIYKKVSKKTIILDLLNGLDLMTFEGNYNIPIKFTENIKPSKISIQNIVLSNNIISKYELSLFPFILIKIREFNNNIFINNSQKHYNTYFIVKDTINLSNNTFIPDQTFSMSNLNISFYDHEENLLKILDFEKKDFIKIFLDIEF